MQSLVETIESRVLLSGSAPAGTETLCRRNEIDGIAGQVIAPIVFEVVAPPTFQRVTTDDSQVQLMIESNGGPEQVLATGEFNNGVVVFRGVRLKTAGGYGLLAVAPDVTPVAESLVVSPARPAALEMNGFANYLHDNTGVQFEIEVVDKFGNMVATDRSRMTLGPATPKGAKVHIVPFDSQGNPFSGALVRHGQQFGYAVQVQVNGLAFFDLTASGVTGTATVKILDSNPAVRPLLSPGVPAQ